MDSKRNIITKKTRRKYSTPKKSHGNPRNITNTRKGSTVNRKAPYLSKPTRRYFLPSERENDNSINELIDAKNKHLKDNTINDAIAELPLMDHTDAKPIFRSKAALKEICEVTNSPNNYVQDTTMNCNILDYTGVNPSFRTKAALKEFSVPNINDSCVVSIINDYSALPLSPATTPLLMNDNLMEESTAYQKSYIEDPSINHTYLDQNCLKPRLRTKGSLKNFSIVPAIIYDSDSNETSPEAEDTANNAPPDNSYVDDIVVVGATFLLNLKHSRPFSKNDNKMCCLQSYESRCQFLAEKDAIDPKVLQEFLRQECNLKIDKSADHLQLCDFHSFVIQNAMSLTNTPEKRGK